MKIRPEIKKGDICRLSKRGKKKYKILSNADAVIIVLKVEKTRAYGTSDGSAVLKCNVVTKFCGRFFNTKRNILRRYLWFTGRNIGDEKHIRASRNDPKSNDGRESCLKCGSPTETVHGFGKDYDICKNSNCDWFNN